MVVRCVAVFAMFVTVLCSVVLCSCFSSCFPIDKTATVCYNSVTMKFNYKLPPLSYSDTFAMLKFFGCNLAPDASSVHVFDSFRLPKISCPLTNNPASLITISFPGPPSFGAQSFSFPADDIPSSHPNPFFNFVLATFSIPKSTISRVYNHKRGYLKIPLNPSINKIKKLLRETKEV